MTPTAKPLSAEEWATWLRQMKVHIGPKMHDRLLATVATARTEALEECAKLVDHYADSMTAAGKDGDGWVAECAHKIRSLKSQ